MRAMSAAADNKNKDFGREPGFHYLQYMRMYSFHHYLRTYHTYVCTGRPFKLRMYEKSSRASELTGRCSSSSSSSSTRHAAAAPPPSTGPTDVGDACGSRACTTWC